MQLYRIAKAAFARDVTGQGAAAYGGRWNHRGTFVLYTAESRALATVEYLVHVALPLAPGGLSLATLEVPDRCAIETVDPASLPANWRAAPAPARLADLGSAWAQAARTLLLRVPSAVVDQEFNVLVNPAHPDAARLKLVRVEPCRLDERLLRRR